MAEYANRFKPPFSAPLRTLVVGPWSRDPSGQFLAKLDQGERQQSTVVSTSVRRIRYGAARPQYPEERHPTRQGILVGTDCFQPPSEEAVAGGVFGGVENSMTRLGLTALPSTPTDAQASERSRRAEAERHTSSEALEVSPLSP